LHLTQPTEAGFVELRNIVSGKLHFAVRTLPARDSNAGVSFDAILPHQLRYVTQYPDFRAGGLNGYGTTGASLVQNREPCIERSMQVMALRYPSAAGQCAAASAGPFQAKAGERRQQEQLALFERYRRIEVPLITPLTLLRHHMRRLPDAYLAHQHYLAPYPESLALRSYTR
jgi:hypothetical protein